MNRQLHRPLHTIAGLALALGTLTAAGALATGTAFAAQNTPSARALTSHSTNPWGTRAGVIVTGYPTDHPRPQ